MNSPNVPRSVLLARAEWDKAVSDLQQLASIGLHTRLHDTARTVHNMRGLIGVLRELEHLLPLVAWIQGSLEETCTKYPPGTPLASGGFPLLHSMSEAIHALITKIGVPPLDPRAPLHPPSSGRFPAAPSVVPTPPSTRRFVLPTSLPPVRKLSKQAAPATVAPPAPDQPDQPNPRLVRETDMDAQTALDEILADDGPENAEAIFHRLKGALNTAGLFRAGYALHTLESAVRTLREKHPEQVATFSRESAKLIAAITCAAVDDQMSDYGRLVAELRANSLTILGDSELPPAPEPPVAAPESTTGASPVRQGIDLSFDALDELINHLLRVEDEMASVRAQTKGKSGEDDEANAQLSSLRSVERALRAKDADGSFAFAGGEEGHRPGFALLDLTRETPVNRLLVPMGEAIDSLTAGRRTLTDRQFEVSQSVERMDRQLRSLRERMLNLRLVEFATLAETCESTVQRKARFEHKQVRLSIVGGQTKIDRRLLQALRTALIAMIGNAIAHGIEKVRPAHKAEVGMVTVTASANEPGKVQIEVRDDGAGIDFAAIQQRAVETNQPTPPNGWTDESLLQLLFSPGFSTRAHADEAAGRGQGTNIVARTVESLGGILKVESKAGEGTVFRLELPAKLDYADLLFVRSGDLAYAVRQVAVSRAELYLPASIFPPGESALRTIQWGEQIAAAILLPRALGQAEEPAGDEWPTIEVQTSAGPLYIAVNRVGESSPSHIRTLDSLLAVPPWSGATTAADGKLVFLLDPSTLWEALRNGQLPPPAHDDLPPPIRRRALVVDDAGSVRRAFSDMLLAAGWEADLFPNGEAAWEAFKRNGNYDVVLTDLEMPRSNGYELLGRIRARDPKIPVFVITSRAGQGHQDEARRLGATSYLVKPVDRTALQTALHYYCRDVYP